jgi:hypothetical protein
LKTAVSLLALVTLPAISWAGKKEIVPPTLTVEHKHPSGAFSFRTPDGWKVQTGDNGNMEAWGADVGVRFLYRDGEVGYDGLHATCILEGLVPMEEQDPESKYEYEFVSWAMGDRRVLDSAQFVRYDDPVRGHRDWRQRTVTVVGGGLSMCVMGYAPTPVWKKSREARVLLEAVMGSLVFSR